MTVKTDRWNAGLAELRASVAEGGSATPSARFVASSGFRLGKWVQACRSHYKAGTLSEAQILALTAIDGWSWDPREDAWRAWYDALVAHVERHGSDAVRRRVGNLDERRLGDWVNGQRMAYRKGELSAERVRLLEAVSGWRWGKNALTWEESFANLLHFESEFGHGRVPVTFSAPAGYPVPGQQLGNWVQTQRKEHRCGALAPQRVKLLNMIDAWVWSVE